MESKITLGQVYYFNNREVIPLRMETQNLAFCVIICDINHDVTGQCFCTQCMVGGDYKGAHTCGDADEVIEAVMEEISDKEVSWIPVQYLKEKPIEFKENEQLKGQIASNSEKLKNIEQSIVGRKNSLASIEQKLIEKSTERDELNECISKLNSTILNLDIELKKKQLNQQKIININNTNISISLDELNSLYKSQITLQLLEAGGVDNWEWYSESIGDNDINKMALDRLNKG